MRADRLLTLLMLLRRRGRMTAPAIAAELEVSVRTVLRDIEALSATGVPVYAERGRTGGFTLLEGFSTDLTGLTHAEAAALFSAGSRSTSTQLGMAPALSSAMAKLIAAMPSEQRRTAERVSQRILVDAEGFTDSRPVDEHIGIVQRAVFTDRRLRFGYLSRASADEDPTIRTVDPIGLVHSAGRWYLVALHRGAERTYRVSRIRSATILDEQAHRPPGVDLAALWNRRRAEFRQGFVSLTVTVAVSPQRRADVEAAALRAREAGGAGEFAPDAARDAPDDPVRRTVLDLEFGDIEHAVAVLWSFAQDVEVLAPQEVRTTIAERAASLTARYRLSAASR
jgi:predicted DNA-binding transcriptional regulator YafY